MIKWFQLCLIQIILLNFIRNILLMIIYAMSLRDLEMVWIRINLISIVIMIYLF